MSDYRPLIAVCAKPHKLDPLIVEAVVLTESGGCADAFRYEPAFYRRYLQGKPEWADCIPRRVSSSYGLMQIMYPVAKELGFTGEPELLFVPSVNLAWGCLKLAKLLEWAGGEYVKAFAAYNGGQGGNAQPPFRNQAYADKVLAQFSKLRVSR